MDANKLQIVYEDNHLLAVAKPAGLLVQGDRSGDRTLLDIAKVYLKKKHGKPGNVYLGLVHRLDRPVSGVVVLARTSKAAGRLSQQFRESTVTKIYLAVVAGIPDERSGELVAHLAEKGDAQGKTRASRQPFTGSREARLSYTVVEQAPDRSLVQVQPITGRRHQIRAQFAMLGHPILGDVKYGSRERLPGRRIALHASRLIVKHPVGQREMVFVCPLSPDWPCPESQMERTPHERN